MSPPSGQAIWIAENIVNLLATGIAAAICFWRWLGAQAALGECGSPSVRAQRRVNAILLGWLTAVSLGLATLGAYLIVVAAGRGPAVDPFILIGTGGFAFIWGGFAWLMIWLWRATGRVVDLARREGLPDRAEGDV